MVDFAKVGVVDEALSGAWRGCCCEWLLFLCECVEQL